MEANTDPGVGVGGGALDGALGLGMITAVASSTVGVGDAVIPLASSDLSTVLAGDDPIPSSLFTVWVLAGEDGFDLGLPITIPLVVSIFSLLKALATCNFCIGDGDGAVLLLADLLC